MDKFDPADERAELLDLADKTKWAPGPWQDEPDQEAFEHAHYSCLIVRNMIHGNLCGYVAVPAGHPWHGLDWGDIEAEVHGGLTYGQSDAPIPTPGVAGAWWIGFDCGHGGLDFMPGMDALLASVPGVATLRAAAASMLEAALGDGPRLMRETYKTIEFVRAQCEALAEQAQSKAWAVS